MGPCLRTTEQTRDRVVTVTASDLVQTAMALRIAQMQALL